MVKRLKKILLALALAAGGSVWIAAAAAAAGSGQPAADGRYKVTERVQVYADHGNGKELVQEYGVGAEVTVAGGAFSGLQLAFIQEDSYDFNEGYVQRVERQLSEYLMDRPALAETVEGFDAVSVATYTSAAAKQAVLQALAQGSRGPVPDQAKKPGVTATSSAVTLRWPAAAQATGYLVLRADGKGGAWKTAGEVTSAAATVTWKDPGKFTAGHTYYYKVRSYHLEPGQTARVYGEDSGTVQLSLSVGKPKIAKITPAAKAVTVRWGKVSGASGYQLVHSAKKSSGYKQAGGLVSKGTTLTAKDTKAAGLKLNKAYYYKVRAYRMVAGQKLWGAYSSPKSLTVKLSRPKISKATPGKKKAVLQWKKVSGADGYQVSRAVKGKSYKTVKTLGKGKTVSWTNTKLASKKTYKYRVRAYRTVGGQKLYSAWSPVKQVKVK